MKCNIGCKLLLCTDMDRTVIPNGVQVEDGHARMRLSKFCDNEGVTLTYVTGRHKALVEEAIKEYKLPTPDYAITDVGTKIYKIINKTWHEMKSWQDEIDRAWNGKSHEQINQLFTPIKELELQEESKQNTHKLSYYLPLDINHENVIARMEKYLEEEGINASLIWSIDEQENIGLLDLLPLNATKLHAIEFLQNQLDYKLEEIVFAGDSGNDLPVLVSAIPSIIVANASKDVKKFASKEAKANGHANSLYIVEESRFGINGNYSSGVLEGIWHFIPAFRNLLKREGMQNE